MAISKDVSVKDSKNNDNDSDNMELEQEYEEAYWS
jgi:hypothetical protein